MDRKVQGNGPRPTIIGPILSGLDKSIQIVRQGAKDSDIVNMAAIAA